HRKIRYGSGLEACRRDGDGVFTGLQGLEGVHALDVCASIAYPARIVVLESDGSTCKPRTLLIGYVSRDGRGGFDLRERRQSQKEIYSELSHSSLLMSAGQTGLCATE